MVILGLPVTAASCTHRVRRADAPLILSEALTAMRSEAMGRERIDWEALERELESRVAAGAPPERAWPLIREALGELGNRHANFFPPMPAALPVDVTTQRAAEAAPATSAQPRIPELPIGKMLDGGAAYILIPIRSQDEPGVLRAYAHEARRLIAEFERLSPSGWIVDLRLNGGGTMWPMFLGLAPLLSDGVHLTSIADDRIQATFGVSGNEVWIDHGAGKQVQLAMAPGDDAPPPIRARPIAVLLGPWTMSSGEAVAIALSLLPGARSFGAHTGRLSTVTQMYTLSDGSVLVLPVSVMGNAEGQAFPEGVEPDQIEAIADWPTDDDEVVHAAMRWIDSGGAP